MVKLVIKGKFAPEGGQKGTPGTPAVPPLSEELVSQVYEDIYFLSPSELSESASELFPSHLAVLDNRHLAAADVHYNADKQQSKSDSKFICHSSVLTVFMCRYFELFFVCCLSALEWPWCSLLPIPGNWPNCGPKPLCPTIHPPSKI